MSDDGHVPVLLEEAVAALDVTPNGRYVDATFGRGGHARAILAVQGPKARELVGTVLPEAAAVPRFGVAAVTYDGAPGWAAGTSASIPASGETRIAPSPVG